MYFIITYIYLIILLFNNVNSQQYSGTATIVDDTYSKDKYCSPTFLINVTAVDSGLKTDSFFFRDFQNIPSTNQKVENIVTTTIGNINYYSFYIKSDIYFENPTTSLHGIDSTYGNEQKIIMDIGYTCEEIPSTLDIPNEIKIIKPNRIVNYFKVYVKNLKKKIKSIDSTNPLSSTPYSLYYISSEPYFLYFRLNLIYSASSPPLSPILDPVLGYKLTFESNTTFNIFIESPMNNMNLNLFQFVSQYPSNQLYKSTSNWDINNLVFLNNSKISAYDVFFYSVVTGYSTNLDSNEYYGLISGNYDKGQFLSLSSFFPFSRDTTSPSSSSNLFLFWNTATSLSQFQTENSAIGVGIGQISQIPNTVDEQFNIVSYSFSYKYQDNYKLAIKVGDCNYFAINYPYGIGILNSNGDPAFYFAHIKNVYTKALLTATSDLGTSSDSPVLYGTIDNDKPILTDFQLYYPKGGDGNYAVLTIKVHDVGSGFLYLNYGGNYVTVSNIISGDINNGTYEKLIYVTFDTTCEFSDIAKNIVPCSISNFQDINFEANPNLNFYVNPFLSIPKLVDYNFEITQFYFEDSIYDLSDTGRLATVYLNFTTANYDTPISFMLLDRIYGDKNVEVNSKSNRYMMDKNLKLFKITFYLPPKLCTGTIPYLFVIYGKRFTNDYFNTKFGTTNTTSLNVISKDCYEFPPKVSELSYIYQSPVDLATIQDDKVGWSFKIETGGNFKIVYAYFHVISQYDKLGYNFTFYPNSNSYTGKLEINFDPSIIKSQTFRIYNCTLIDERGIRSDQIDSYTVEEILINNQPKYPLSISPLYQIEKTLLELQVISHSTLVDIILPSIGNPTSLSFSQNDLLDCLLSFQVNTLDDLGLSRRHIPQAYLESYTNFGDLQVIQCNTTEISFNFLTAVYNIECITKYGFGFENGVSVSIFGVADLSLNMVGINSALLLNFQKNFSTTKPSIHNWSPLTPNNDRLTISGLNLPKSGGYAYLYYTDGDYDNQIALKYIYQSSVLVELEIPKSNKPFVIYVQNSINQQSNKVEIHYLDEDSSTTSSSSSEDLPVVQCLDNCGGPSRGICISNKGCRCYSPYSGLNCMSEIVIIPQPQINSTSPDSRNEFPINGSNIKLNTIVSFIAVRELDNLGNQVNIHYFDIWNLTTISKTKYSYTSKIYKNNQYASDIIVDMEWYDNSTTISFANQNITLNPSSLKYYITLENYPFTSTLNSFELIIKSFLKSSQSNVCSSKDFALNDGNDFMTISIGKYSFEGKFIKKGILNNNKIISIDNKLLDSFNSSYLDKDSSNQQSSFISIQIPHFDKILLDPSFSVLVNPNGANKNSANSICSNKSKLTAAQIVGIVIGGLVFIVIISLVLLYKFSNSSRFLGFKIFIYKIFRKNIKL